MGRHKQRLIAFLVLALVVLQPIASVVASVGCTFHDGFEQVASMHDNDGLDLGDGSSFSIQNSSASHGHMEIADSCERIVVMADIKSSLAIGSASVLQCRVTDVTLLHFVDATSSTATRPPIYIA